MLLEALCIISKPSVYSTSSYSPKTTKLGQTWRFLVPRDREIWWITLKNNRAHLLWYFKMCSSFHNHRLIPPKVIVQKRPIWRMTLKNNRAPLLSSIKLCALFHCRVWIQTGVMVIDLWPLTLTFCMDITSVNGNNSWKCQVDTMTGTLSKRCDGRTDGQTDGRTDRQTDRRQTDRQKQTDRRTDRRTDGRTDGKKCS